MSMSNHKLMYMDGYYLINQPNYTHTANQQEKKTADRHLVANNN